MLLGLVSIAASVLNSERHWLKCEQGQRVAHKGLPLPFGHRALSRADYPPLAVSGVCQEERFDHPRELRARYDELASKQRPPAKAPSALASILDAWRRLATVPNGPLAPERKALVLSQLRAEVAAVRVARERARLAIEQALRLGIDPATVERLRQELDEVDAREASRPGDEVAARLGNNASTPSSAAQSDHDRPL